MTYDYFDQIPELVANKYSYAFVQWSLVIMRSLLYKPSNCYHFHIHEKFSEYVAESFKITLNLLTDSTSKLPLS